MYTSMKLPIAALATAAALVACSGKGSTDAAKADFSRDLQLASATTMNLATPKVDPSLITLENKPQGMRAPAPTLRKGAGNRAVRSSAPTVAAEPTIDIAEMDDSDVAETVAEAPVPEPTPEPIAEAPRPTAPVIPTSTAGDYGTSGNGGGVLGGGTGRGGVVIRGGGVDGDNCELHRGGTRRGPVYIPNSGGIRVGTTMGIPQRTFPVAGRAGSMRPRGR